MKITKLSASLELPTHYEATDDSAQASALRIKRDTPLSHSSEDKDSADAKVAESFSNALADASYRTAIRPPGIYAPPQSEIGRWRSLLDGAFNAAGFLEWAKQNKLETRHLTLVPSRGEIVGHVEGRVTTFSMSDDSGWSDISRTLLAIGKVFAPEPGQELQYPGYGDNEIPMNLVAQFYAEPVFPRPEEAEARARQLKENPSFKLPERYVSARSDAALAVQQHALGDDANRHALIAALKTQVDDSAGNIALDNVMVRIDPRSVLFGGEQKNEMSVAQLLRLEGNKVPVNSDQAFALAMALSFDLAHRAPGADEGGVRPLAGMLGSTSLRKMKRVVDAWKAQQRGPAQEPSTGPAAGSLLSRLITALPQTARNVIADNPSLALDQLIRSPAAQALGKDIEQTLKLVETPTSAIESVSAALVQELDPGAGKSRFNLAGYNVYDVNNAGIGSAEIVKRFTAHLQNKVGVEGAPIAALLLLSAAAPEFLVKDIPSQLLYGSHTWVNFCIEVARIEQQVPGASANMTFNQVMAFGSTPLISLEGEDQLNAAAHDPIIAWGIANGVVKSSPAGGYADVDAGYVSRALNKQQEELAWADEALKTPATTRRELALAQLRREFPGIDPTQRMLWAQGYNDVRVSLLDVYMSGPVELNKWRSIDEKAFPYQSMKARFSNIIHDINKLFSGKFDDYIKVKQRALAIQFRYQLSLLPMSDREFIKTAKVDFFEVSRVRPPKINYPQILGGLILDYPTTAVEQVEGIKGRHGLLMRAVGENGEIRSYSYFPAEGRMVQEVGLSEGQLIKDARSYFGRYQEEESDSGLPLAYQQYTSTHSPRDSSGPDGEFQGAYFSTGNGELAVTAADFFAKNYAALKFQAEGVTALETVREDNDKLKALFLSLVPFYDGIQDAVNGNVAGAIFNIGFDILGFFIPGSNATRKAAKAGKSALSVIRSAASAGIGNSVGYTDSVNIIKNLNKAALAGFKDAQYLAKQGDVLLSRMKGSYGRYDVTKVYKDGDVVKGFFHSAEKNVWLPTVAVFKKGGWYSYNIVTKTPFGVQLAQFGVAELIAP